MTSVISAISASTDGFGRWQAHVVFTHSLSESDHRAEYNLGRHWARIRARARDAVVAEITDREQKTNEPRPIAERRVRSSLPRFVVLGQDLDSLNCWHGVTLGEPRSA